MVRARTRPGERRIDAAIDHLAGYGFPKTRIRRVVNELLKLYGRDGWVFLEDGQYRVVLEKLLEEQEEPQQNQQPEGAAAAEEASPENDVQVSLENHMQLPDDLRCIVQQLEAAAAAEEASPENDVQVSLESHMQLSGMQNVGQIDKSQLVLQPQASHNNSPSFEPVMPLPQAKAAVPASSEGPPCYGWISDISDSESELQDEKVPTRIQSPKACVPYYRRRKKQPSRWDVGSN